VGRENRNFERNSYFEPLVPAPCLSNVQDQNAERCSFQVIPNVSTALADVDRQRKRPDKESVQGHQARHEREDCSMASIDERGKNKWRIRVFAGRQPGTGKKRYIAQTVHGGYREAQRTARKLQTGVEESGYVRPSNITLSQYLQQWLKDRAEPRVRPRTFNRYKEIVQLHLIPNLGNIRLKQLQPEHIEAYYAKARKQGRLDGKGGLSAQTVQHHAQVLNQSLSHAVKTKVIGRNEAKDVSPPRPLKKEIEPLTREEVGILLASARQTEFYFPLLVAVYTGLRRSELLALTWKDMDLEERYLKVNKGIHTHSTKEQQYQAPKTAKSKRRVSLPNDLVLALRHYRETQEATREQLGISLTGENLVFSRADGSSIHPDSLSKACIRLAKRPV